MINLWQSWQLWLIQKYSLAHGTCHFGISWFCALLLFQYMSLTAVVGCLSGVGMESIIYNTALQGKSFKRGNEDDKWK